MTKNERRAYERITDRTAGALRTAGARASRIQQRSLKGSRRRIEDSKLIIYPDSGRGGIFQFHDRFGPTAVEFLHR